MTRTRGLLRLLVLAFLMLPASDDLFVRHGVEASAAPCVPVATLPSTPGAVGLSYFPQGWSSWPDTANATVVLAAFDPPVPPRSDSLLTDERGSLTPLLALLRDGSRVCEASTHLRATMGSLAASVDVMSGNVTAPTGGHFGSYVDVVRAVVLDVFRSEANLSDPESDSGESCQQPSASDSAVAAATPNDARRGELQLLCDGEDQLWRMIATLARLLAAEHAPTSDPSMPPAATTSPTTVSQAAAMPRDPDEPPASPAPNPTTPEPTSPATPPIRLPDRSGWTPLHMGTLMQAAVASLLDGTLILFGGRRAVLSSFPILSGDTWRFDGASWRMLFVASPTPEPRYAHTLTTLVNGDVLLYGGITGTTVTGSQKAWVFRRGNLTWQRLPDALPGRFGHCVAPLPDGGALVIGGMKLATSQSETHLRLHATNWSWTERTAASAASLRAYAVAVTLDHIGSMGSVLVFGGTSPQLTGQVDATGWILDLSSWKWAPIPTAPAAMLTTGQLAAVPFHRGALVLGGHASGPASAFGLWFFNASASEWSVVNVTGDLDARLDVRAAWVQGGGEPSSVVVVGGFRLPEPAVNTYMSDTWSLQIDPTDDAALRRGDLVWSCTEKQPPPFGPNPNLVGVIGGIVLHDGYASQTYVFNLTSLTWRNATAPSATMRPARRQFTALAPMDLNATRVLLMGGGDVTTGAEFNDTWLFNVTDAKWYRLSDAPFARARHRMAPITYCAGGSCDPQGGVVLVGGEPKNVTTWLFLRDSLTWRNIVPQSGVPFRRDHVLVPVNKGLLLVGGTIDTRTTNDWGALQAPAGTNPTLANLQWTFERAPTDIAFLSMGGGASCLQGGGSDAVSVKGVVLFGSAQGDGNTTVFSAGAGGAGGLNAGTWSRLPSENDPQWRLAPAMTSVVPNGPTNASMAGSVASPALAGCAGVVMMGGTTTTSTISNMLWYWRP